MNLRQKMLTSFAVLAAVAHCGLADRTVRVTFSCRDASGKVLADVPISGRTLVGAWGSKTNAAGVSEIDIVVRDGERTIRYSWMPKEVQTQEELDYRGMIRARDLAIDYFIHRTELLVLAPEQVNYTISMSFPPAREVHFRCLDANGTPVRASVFGPGLAQNQMPVIDGNMVVRGVPVDEPSVLLVLTYPSIFELPVPAGAGDLDLGIVTPAAPVHDATAGIELVNGFAADQRGYETDNRIFLVSVDGRRLLQLSTWKARSTAAPGDSSPSALPSGEYWVSPFQWSDVGTSGALLKLVRSGVDLADSGVPKLVVAPGGHTELQVDVAAAQKAILERAVAAGLWPEY